MTNLRVELSGSVSGSAGVWAHIEQVLADDKKYADFYDISQMFAMAQSGLTAHTYNRNCAGMSIDNDSIAIPLSVYVWPSVLDLNYALRVVDADGTSIDSVIGVKRAVSVSRENSFVVGLSDRLRFDHLLDRVQLQFETPCYSRYGVQIPPPGWVVSGNEVIFDCELFASVRMQYAAVGFQHTITLLWESSSEAIAEIKEIAENVRVSIAGVTVVVTCDGSGDSADITDESMTLDIPDSVTNCLSQCDDGHLKNGSQRFSATPPDDSTPGEEQWRDVYYSACDGHVVGTNRRMVAKK